MENVRPFFAVQHFYNCLWNYNDRKMLEECFDDNVIFHISAMDDPNKKISWQGKKELMDKFFNRWFDMVDGKNTKIINFSIEMVGLNIYSISYCIEQRHYTNNEWIPYKIYAIDSIELEEHNNKWTIHNINFTRIKKMAL